MKIYIQRDRSELSARYRIFDELGRPRFTVTGKSSSLIRSMRIITPDNETVCRIRGLGFSALTVFSISSGNESMRLNISVGSGRVSVSLSGISFFLRGDALIGSYSVLDADNSVVCTVGKDFAKSSIGMELNQADRELFCIAIAVCIDSLTVGCVPTMQAT